MRHTIKYNLKKGQFLFKEFIKTSPKIKLKISDCSTISGFSYKKTGWHHLIKLCEELDFENNLTLEKSILYKFHEQFQPKDNTELVKHNNVNVRFKPPFGIFPWADFGINQHINLDFTTRNKLKNSLQDYCYTCQNFVKKEFMGDCPGCGTKTSDFPHGSFCGPSSLVFLAERFNVFKKIYSSIKLNGYQRFLAQHPNTPHGLVGGTILKRIDGSKRFVVQQGNHRLAVLAHLGYDVVDVGFVKGKYKVINEKELEDWHYVKNKQCSCEDAHLYFNSFFELDGTEIAKRINLI